MSVLSIQSSVAAGHVGNSAAAFALQRLGIPVWRIDTVVFSNHPAYGDHKGRVVPTADLAALLDGLAARDLWPHCRGILSGYLGDAGTGPLLAATVAAIRQQSPKALYLCDPVIGDAGDIYVGNAVVDFYRSKGMVAADIVTPNAFEAAHLTGLRTNTVAGAVSAARALRRDPSQIVVVTGIKTAEATHTIALDGRSAWQVTTPTVDGPSYGAGDLFAALLLGHLLGGADLRDALARSVSSVHGVLTGPRGALDKDIALVPEQACLAEPPQLFPATILA
ncbi:MAG: pyridoxal kinase [Pseudomonadota bacterium]